MRMWSMLGLNSTLLPLLAGAALLVWNGPALAADGRHGGIAGHHVSPTRPPEKAAPAGDPYLLDKDVVSGQKIDKPVILTFQGRELRFASRDSANTFQAAPAKYLARIDQDMIRRQLPHYPLTTCLVTDEPLGGEMGEPINYIHRNRLVRFCCEMCKAKFDKNTAAYLARLDAAAKAAQKDSYPLKTCPVTGAALGEMGEPVDHVAGNRLVRFCCPGCVAKFNKDPLPAIAQLDGAGKSAAPAAAVESAEDSHGRHNHGHGH